VQKPRTDDAIGRPDALRGPNNRIESDAEHHLFDLIVHSSSRTTRLADEYWTTEHSEEPSDPEAPG
jgi:hypothetical protein